MPEQRNSIHQGICDYEYKSLCLCTQLWCLRLPEKRDLDEVTPGHYRARRNPPCQRTSSELETSPHVKVRRMEGDERRRRIDLRQHDTNSSGSARTLQTQLLMRGEASSQVDTEMRTVCFSLHPGQIFCSMICGEGSRDPGIQARARAKTQLSEASL
ncbi:unnamed protein product [Arctogadus glacialis]